MCGVNGTHCPGYSSVSAHQARVSASLISPRRDCAPAGLDAHRDELSRAAVFPPHYGPLLRRLAASRAASAVNQAKESLQKNLSGKSGGAGGGTGSDMAAA